MEMYKIVSTFLSVLGSFTILAYYTADQLKGIKRADSSHDVKNAKRQSGPIIKVSDIAGSDIKVSDIKVSDKVELAQADLRL